MVRRQTVGYGSPPRAWGQFRQRVARHRLERFTPTGVGTIFCAIKQTQLLTVHPHGRGDNRRPAFSISHQNGSPPRAWGQWSAQSAPLALARFTPTGVGTILRATAGRYTTPVHPHGRGDNLVASAAEGVNAGSPPRAWGQWRRASTPSPRGRFTPTGVGTMPSARCTPLRRAVHPHGRGDNTTVSVKRADGRGSPPRAWGQSGSAPPRAARGRFTPTGVGTMRSCGSSSGSVSVHPHGRGDNRLTGEALDSLCGSPPRAWGQFGRRNQTLKERRFTPTGVGTICRT